MHFHFNIFTNLYIRLVNAEAEPHAVQPPCGENRGTIITITTQRIIDTRADQPDITKSQAQALSTFYTLCIKITGEPLAQALIRDVDGLEAARTMTQGPSESSA